MDPNSRHETLQRGGEFHIIRMSAQRLAQHCDGGLPIARFLQRHGVHIGKARVVGLALGGFLQQGQRFREPLLPDERQRERMMRAAACAGVPQCRAQ